MKIKERLKMMDKTDKSIMILAIIIFLLLVINGWASIHHAHQFTERTNAGNARWKQVEERILEYEHKIEVLEKDIENLQLKIDCKGGQ